MPDRPSPTSNDRRTRRDSHGIIQHLREKLTLVGLLILTGLLTGSACALFLWSLDAVTRVRFQTPWLIWLLPLAGAGLGWITLKWGGPADRGNNLIIDEIHQPGAGVPRRMAPLILLTTLITHLFGGSAGREGTAVQMGASLSASLSRLVPRLGHRHRRLLLMAGVAAGFGGVFGTPVAGALFAMEVLVIGHLHTKALLACLLAAIISDQTCIAWGASHTHYHVASLIPAGVSGVLAPLTLRLVIAAVVCGALAGLASWLFVKTTHGISSGLKRICPSPILRPVIGGVVLLAMVWLAGTRDYLGLGVTSPVEGAVTISSSFEPGGAHPFSWLAKLWFTAVTIGSGFKGGEVTPLFFIGATLGNQLAGPLGVPVDVLAAIGFLAVFAGATNTPIACTVMGVELFGGELTACFAIGCVLANLTSGRTGIYTSQRAEPPGPG